MLFAIAFAGYTFVNQDQPVTKFIYMLLRSKLILFLALCGSGLFAQKLKKADKTLLNNLQLEIRYLADDKMEGRRAGTAGEKLASDYISAEFQNVPLQPKGENGKWLQPFEIFDGKQINAPTHFLVNGKTVLLDKEFLPLAYSASKKAEATMAVALQESGVPWFVDLKEIQDANQGNPHFDMDEAIRGKIKDCAKKGATAVVFYHSGAATAENTLSFNPKDRSQLSSIPVLYITAEAKKKYFPDEAASNEVKINVDITDKIRTGHNVVGYLDNGAATTVIIGAHYDHLGYGEDGNSMYRGTEKLIHNGADDNASGTVAMIELAKMIKQSHWKGNNYLFIAFSGEELGLFGSKYFSEHPTLDLSKVNYMFNMDMVGRLNDSTHSLTIGGYGTSPEWGLLFRDHNDSKYFNLKFDSSGTGPSDYTSFYRKDIPVLFFFTGLHSDYHRPTDDYDKINYNGEMLVIKYIYELLGDLNSKGKLAFAKTRETQTTSSARFSVTMGIMPDYTFSGTGVRVDGVSDGKPAQKAGLKTGDVIIKLGDYPVSSLENYMQALGKFKKGDHAKVSYKRASETLVSEVQF